MRKSLVKRNDTVEGQRITRRENKEKRQKGKRSEEFVLVSFSLFLFPSLLQALPALFQDTAMVFPPGSGKTAGGAAVKFKASL